MAEVDDKKLKKLEKMLNSAICELLYGPSGDPGWSELSGAATCFKVLKMFDLKIKGEKDIRRELEGENVYNDNFIKGI